MKPKSIKHVEWYILDYLINGESANLSVESLSDLADKLSVHEDAIAEKRFKGACNNIETVLSNMLSKRPEPEDEVIE